MEDLVKLASAPHERLMINLALFHLLLPVAALSSGHVAVLLTISLIGSASIIALIARRAARGSANALVDGHWRLAWQRCRLLLMAYGVSAVIMLVGYLLSLAQPDHNMATIMIVVFSRIAAVPIVLMVLALFIMETTALSNARQGTDAH